MKNQETRAKVYNWYDKKKIDRIKYILGNEKRYYSKDEIEKLCEKYNVDINLILQHISGSSKEKQLSNITNLLDQKGKIWIGKTRCSKEFANKHSETLIKELGKISVKLSQKYRGKHLAQDIGSDAIVYILEKSGDIEKNFNDDDEIARDIIKARAYIYIKYRYMKSLKKPKEFSFHREFTRKGDKEETNVFDRGIKDDTQNVEAEVEKKELKRIRKIQKNNNPQEACIELLMKYIELGLSREEALSKTGEKLGINQEEMLKILQKYMIEKKKVRVTANGEYVLGE